jgi:hypothetical protein
MIKDSKHIVNL